MSEIVVAEPIYEGDLEEPQRPVTRAITMGSTSYHNHVPEPFESERLPATLASEIQRFLRVANLIESEEPRIAYLCELFCFVFFLFVLLVKRFCFIRCLLQRGESFFDKFGGFLD